MNDFTLRSLEASIKKWEGIVAGTTPDLGITNCALCHAFFRDECAGCPVRLRTGKPGCRKTPYERWSKVSASSWERIEGKRWLHYPFVRTDQQRAAAQAELDFLRSLLPGKKERGIKAWWKRLTKPLRIS